MATTPACHLAYLFQIHRDHSHRLLQHSITRIATAFHTVKYHLPRLPAYTHSYQQDSAWPHVSFSSYLASCNMSDLCGERLAYRPIWYFSVRMLKESSEKLPHRTFVCSRGGVILLFAPEPRPPITWTLLCNYTDYTSLYMHITFPTLVFV